MIEALLIATAILNTAGFWMMVRRDLRMDNIKATLVRSERLRIEEVATIQGIVDVCENHGYDDGKEGVADWLDRRLAQRARALCPLHQVNGFSVTGCPHCGPTS